MKEEQSEQQNEHSEQKNEHYQQQNVLLRERYHPPLSFKFPQTEVFGTKRRCKHEWFEIYDWLHYDIAKNSVFCITCSKVYQQNNFFNSKIESAFMTGKGFSDWSHASKAFQKHVKSECHVEAVSKVKSEQNIGKVISIDYQLQQEQNRDCLLKIIDIVKFLGRQGLPFRGHGDEENGNFNQLIKLQSKYSHELSE